jgi:hypothetical protein
MKDQRGLDPLTDDVIHRIEPRVLDSLTPAQFSAIVEAIQTSSRESRIIDIRSVLPLYFARYYCIVMICRDRRPCVQKTETFRRNRYSLMGGIVFASLGALPFLLLLFLFLYLLKYSWGIDIIPEFHLYDIFE